MLPPEKCRPGNRLPSPVPPAATEQVAPTPVLLLIDDRPRSIGTLQTISTFVFFVTCDFTETWRQGLAHC